MQLTHSPPRLSQRAFLLETVKNFDGLLPRITTVIVRKMPAHIKFLYENVVKLEKFIE